MLTFHKLPPPEKAATALLGALLEPLNKGSRVLWLVPGGSNIPLSVKVMDQIPDDLTKNLVMMLTDERFGPVDHKDSNLRQLAEAGFDNKQAIFVPTLVAGKYLEETVTYYDGVFNDMTRVADTVIAQFGIGPDGHIAGIKPHSPAVTDKALAAGYKAEDFTRITLTPAALIQASAAYAFVYGDSKLDALEKLKNEGLSLEDEPAQLLKLIPKSFVYNDQIE